MTTRKINQKALGLTGVSLTKARTNQHSLSIMQIIMNEISEVMLSSGYLENAPFEWITIALRYGLQNEEVPNYQKINKKYGDLPLAIELDTHELIDASRDELKRLFMIATLKSLIHAGRKYERPIEDLEDLLKEQNIVKF